MSTIYLVITFNTIDSPNFTLPKNPACEEFEKWRAIHASVGDVGGVGGVGDVLAWVTRVVYVYVFMCALLRFGVI